MSDAMTGLNTGNRADKPEKREQEILTPRNICEMVRLIIGGQIDLDPCAAVDDLGDPLGYVGAKRHFNGTLAAPVPECQDGLTRLWEGHVFCNPPYADLKLWLAKATAEYLRDSRRVVMVLCPARSNRAWWRTARTLACEEGVYVELDPFPFVGFEKHTLVLRGKRAGQARTSDECAPMAMCLMVFGTSPSRQSGTAWRKRVSQALARAEVGGQVFDVELLS